MLSVDTSDVRHNIISLSEQVYVDCFLLLICKPDHKDRREDIEDSHLRRLDSLHSRNHSHDNLLCLFHVSNVTIVGETFHAVGMII